METKTKNNGLEAKNKNNNTKEEDTERTNWRVLVIVFISLVLDLLAFTVILPLLPSILDFYGSHAEENSLYHTVKTAVSGFRVLVGAPDTPRWNSVLFGGMLGSLFSFLQYLSSPLIGAVSDVYGRKRMLLLTSVGIASSYALWAVSHSFSLFVLARILGGISKGNISLSTTIVSDVTRPQDRTKGMAVIGIAFSVGFLLGPLIGAYFSLQARELALQPGGGAFYVAPALFALSLAIINVVFIAVCMPETLPRHKWAKSLGSGFSRAVPLINPAMLFRFTAVQHTSVSDVCGMQNVGVVYFLYLFFYSGLEFTLTFITHNRFNYDSMQQGKMFFFIGLIMILVQGGFVRRIKPGKEISTVSKGLVVLIPAFIVVAFAHSQSVLYLGLGLYSFASAVVVPCLTTVASSYGPVDQKGTVLGIFRSLGALARSLGPIFASTVYWSMGPVVCYIVGGVSLLLPLYLLRRVKLRTD